MPMGSSYVFKIESGSVVITRLHDNSLIDINVASVSVHDFDSFTGDENRNLASITTKKDHIDIFIFS